MHSWYVSRGEDYEVDELEVVGEREVWPSLLRLLPQQPGLRKAEENEWMMENKPATFHFIQV